MRDSARSVGCRLLEVRDPIQGAVVPLALLYPASGPERSHSFGPYALDLAMDAPVDGERLPLVMLSHGNNGTPWAYRGLASHLARSGFAVGLVEHPGNSRNDNSPAGTAANLENRPRHISLAIDAAFADPSVGSRLVPDRVAVIGHSIGAYTALALAGGKPWAAPHETPDGKARPVRVARDERVHRLVLLAPAAFWFMPEGALGEVLVPMLILSGEKDAITTSWHAEIVLSGVRDPALIDHESIAGAGHFSFMSPFPAAMVRPDFPPSQDPEGFDRARFLPVLEARILAFLGRDL